MVETETVLNLPVIHFSTELKPGTSEWESLRAQVFKELQFYGSFEAVFDKVPEDVPKSAFSSAKEFIDLPMETKLKAAKTTAFTGYTAHGATESIAFDEDYNYDYYVKLIWPDGNPKFIKNMKTYFDQISELDKMVRRMVFESLGVEEYLEEHMKNSYYQPGFGRYTSSETKTTVADIHNDYTFVSIIHQNGIDGLEIENKDGHLVHFKPSSPRSYAVIIGEMLSAWMNGRVHCPPHKVTIAGGEKDRYSLILFSFPTKGYIVETPRKLVDESHPLAYKPFEFSEFWRFHYSKAIEGIKPKSYLKAYCGV